MSSDFDLPYEHPPTDLPIFPLTGATLMPRSQLPLEIFEPRYLNMTLAALGETRMIGMIQPRDSSEKTLYEVGCAGRITAFTEAPQRRLLITLTGVIRFRIGSELPMTSGFRRVLPDWEGFSCDLEPPHESGTSEDEIGRTELIELLRRYFAAEKIEADWSLVEGAPDEALVNSLAMNCPFSPIEKQALLEANSLKERSGQLVTLMKLALHGGADRYPV